MRYELEINEQRNQLIKVLDYLKSKGITQKKIAIELGVDNIYISHLRSGTIKNITPEIIEALHDTYNINPHFIIYGASNMFDTAGLKYENFDIFVDSWDLVEHENNKQYIHFTMDENFYKFLINVFHLKKASSKSDDVFKTSEAFDKALDSLKKVYPSSTDLKDYVLIPADNVVEIAHANNLKKEKLNEFIDILNLTAPQK